MADGIDDCFEDFLEFFLHRESWDRFEGFQLEGLWLARKKSGGQLEISSDETENTKWILARWLVQFSKLVYLFFTARKQNSKAKNAFLHKL